MKRKLLVTALIATMGSSSLLAAPNDLFFSEYIEGSSNNKALEIANLTNSSIDLSGYQIAMYFNGNTSPSLTFALNGNVAAGDVFVVAQASASDSILAQADQTQGSGWFNGDDAIVLLKDGNIIDRIGQIGFDPGSEWGTDLISTANNTLRRHLDISNGDNDASVAFDPALQWDGFDNDTFDNLGQIDIIGGPGQQASCGDATDMIHDIQGSGTTTAMSGTAVQIEGIVVGDFQGTDKLRGFFVQEEDSDRDADDKTSEGIFVFDSAFGVDVQLGDKVRVAGSVSEYSGMTQVGNVSDVLICASNQSVSSTLVSLPFTSSDEAEKWEGMQVEFSHELTVSENYNLGRYGELVLSHGRLMIPTNTVLPGAPAIAMQAQNDLNRITLDDGSSRQNPQIIPFPAPQLSAFNSVRGGDSIPRLNGIMHQAYGSYRIQVNSAPDFQASNPRIDAPEMLIAPLKVASFNVLNYFNGDGFGGGFPTARGANTYEEFQRQRNKIIAALSAMDADVIGLMEIENDGFVEESAIADLVAGLSASTGKQYRFVKPDVEKIGSDAITVGMIFNADRVTEVGVAATLASGAFADKNRQPLAQTFREIDSNGQFTLVVNHLKSKGSCPSNADDSNADQGDGQGCWNTLRAQAATELVSWIQSMPTQVTEKDVLVIGDLNAYSMEDPVRAIESLGFNNLIKTFSPDSYSYVFYGQAGSLDQALASKHFGNQIVGAMDWHINADEPHVLDYNIEFKSTEQVTSLYNADPFRASDHDPVIIGLHLKPSFDVNNDNRVNGRDISAVARQLFHDVSAENRRFDFNRDGRVDLRDLEMLIRHVK